MRLLCTLLLWFFTMATVSGQTNYRIGRGMADMTGLASEGALYGYAKPSQDARGLHTRQYARAFVFENGGKRVALSVSDNAMISQALHKEVLERLEILYGDLYTEENVMLTAQHSHASPGGINTYYIYMVPAGGFINETFYAYADGIVTAIQRAHDDLQDGNVLVNSGDLVDANLNRSPYAYDNNPQSEKDMYQYNVDKDMTVLKLLGAAGEDLAMANFYAVHTTSMKNYNHLVSADNKGYAAQMFERNMTNGRYPSEATFVAAFAQKEVGDASPNTDGSRCNETNEYCSYNTSICPENPNDPALCTGRGPAGEQFEDAKIIGDLQYNKARELYDGAEEVLTGPVDHRFMWVNMTEVIADLGGGETGELCGPGMGYSFAAGATDGPGIYPFTQGMLEGIPVLDDLVDSLWGVPQELADCQQVKPILLPTAVMGNLTWAWQPDVVPLQLFRIGDVIIIGVPAEVTTMAGRRLGNAVKDALVNNGFPATTRTIVAALSNLFTSYIVTYEEYQMQRYEGASTIYGPYTLDGYITKFVEMAEAMAKDEPLDVGDEPPDLRSLPSLTLEAVLPDATDPGLTHGDILVDAQDFYQTGETVFATFVSGNPRNDLKTDNTFLEVQRQEADTSWTVVYTDVHWETKYIWSSNCQNVPPPCILPNITGCTPFNRTKYLCGREQFSNGTVEWDISSDDQPGTYRLVHFGHAKLESDVVVSYTGLSKAFQVTTATGHVTRRHSKEYYIATGEGQGYSELDDSSLLQFMQMYFGAAETFALPDYVN